VATLKITLKSDLCAGSGESTGITVDTDLCIDAAGLPYIPARRLKGCLRESAQLLKRYGCREATDENIAKLFGTSEGGHGCLRIRDAKLPGADTMRAWLADGVPDALKTEAESLNVARLFTYVRGQTKLENGVAVDSTLRYTRVMDRYNALDREQEAYLEAPIDLRSTDETLRELLKKSCRATRHIGTMRNRGLGNVEMQYIDAGGLRETESKTVWAHGAHDAETVRINYKISLDAPVTLPGCAEQQLEIPARSVIGCAAASYLVDGNAEDAQFSDLFLNGNVKWSSLTPTVNGRRSVPTPLMLVLFKNERVYRNLFAAQKKEGKQKTLGSTFAAETRNGFDIAEVRSHTAYHHSHGEDGTLYMQDSLDAGMIYAGTVSAPASLADQICDLLRNADFSFGRSRSAQYAACGLYGDIEVTPAEHAVAAEQKTALQGDKAGTAVYAVLQSDLILTRDGCYVTEAEAVRAELARSLHVKNEVPAGRQDYCAYHTVGGYQQMWQMQKPQIPAVRGGSVYCFVSERGDLPKELTLGEYQQEGFGRFRIYTQAEMAGLTAIKKQPVDAVASMGAESAWINKLKTALIVSAGKRAIRDRAREYYASNKVGGIRRGTVGRLRLMTSEASDYADLLARIESIKASDESAENQVSDGKKALKCVCDVCGDRKVELSHLLAGHEALLSFAEADRAAKEQLEGEWKAALMSLLHMAYFDQGGGRV